MIATFSAWEVFNGSDGELTKAFFAELQLRGKIGEVAIDLFRAQKSSSRAKVYRGGVRGKGSYRSMAYERKGWALERLSQTLEREGREIGIRFGWGRDEKTMVNSWVLYVDLPDVGQVSFHSPCRYGGPDYPGEWDGSGLSAERIIKWCQMVLDGDSDPTALPPETPMEQKARLERRMKQLSSMLSRPTPQLQAEFSEVCRKLNALRKSSP